MNEVIVERKIFAISPKGEKKKFHIAIRRPYRVNIDTEEWACPVQLDGLYENLHKAHGIDSWQSLILALSLIHQLLGHFLANGGKLYWEEDGEELSLNDLFPEFPENVP